MNSLFKFGLLAGFVAVLQTASWGQDSTLRTTPLTRGFLTNQTAADARKALGLAGVSANGATFQPALPVTNFDTSTLFVTNVSIPGGFGTFSNVSGLPYEFVKGYTEAGSDFFTTMAAGIVRLNGWGNPVPLAQCSTNSFPLALSAGFKVTGAARRVSR